MSESELRRYARQILAAALRAADPAGAIERHLHLRGEVLTAGRVRYRLAGIDRIYVVGAGKASAAMARAVERILGRRVAGGLINTKDGHCRKLRRIECHECGHPLPDARGVQGAQRIAQIVSEAGKDDLVIALISGGASALLPLPAEDITLEAKQEATRLLLACGANIHEINAVRKHISRIKGGQLARLAYPARVLSLLLSDVIGDDLDVIGSGPAAPDASTFAQAYEILEKYGITSKVAAPVLRRIEQGMRGEIEETPKPGDAVFKRTQNLVVGSNELAVAAAAAQAREAGFHTMVLSTTIEGETREVARVHAAIAREVARRGRPLKRPACIISGGETTVTLRGSGLGGRNQEFALAAAIDIAGLENTVVLSAGTDGTDGPTDAAGAIADGHTAARGPEARRYLDANDSYHFFEALGDLIKTGPTGTNVMDIRLMLVG